MAAGDLSSLAIVGAAVIACMGYSRLAARRLRPGLPRLTAFLPVLAVLPFLPLAFTAIHPRVISGFFLAWMAEFKLLLLACGQGPLHPTLPLTAFVAVATFPVTLRHRHPNSSGTMWPASLGFVEDVVMAALLAAVASLYRYEAQMNEYVLLTLYTVHLYLALELVLAAAAATARALMALDLQPQFNWPYLSASLRDFWGRRWNLSVSALLRQCVFRPVRARLGAPAGVLSAFAVSGLMHEAMFSYITLRPLTGEAAVFIALHGACAVAEGWWAAHEGWPRPPRVLATPLTLAFVGVTGFWLFFPPITRTGADKQVIRECEAMVTFLQDAAVWAVDCVSSILYSRFVNRDWLGTVYMVLK